MVDDFIKLDSNGFYEVIGTLCAGAWFSESYYFFWGVSNFTCFFAGDSDWIGSYCLITGEATAT